MSCDYIFDEYNTFICISVTTERIDGRAGNEAELSEALLSFQLNKYVAVEVLNSSFLQWIIYLFI